MSTEIAQQYSVEAPLFNLNNYISAMKAPRLTLNWLLKTRSVMGEVYAVQIRVNTRQH
jgi:hypothetical protein